MIDNVLYIDIQLFFSLCSPRLRTSFCRESRCVQIYTCILISANSRASLRVCASNARRSSTRFAHGARSMARQLYLPAIGIRSLGISFNNFRWKQSIIVRRNEYTNIIVNRKRKFRATGCSLSLSLSPSLSLSLSLSFFFSLSVCLSVYR